MDVQSEPQKPLPALAGMVDVGQAPDQAHVAERRLYETMLSDLPFGDEYLALLGEGWFWRDAAYIAWKSMPSEYRQPKNYGEFCDLIGISRNAMLMRRQKNKAIEIRAAKLTAGRLFEHMDDVVEALVESASNPNYKNHPDRKLYLEMTGAYTPKSSLELGMLQTEDAPLDDLNEDDLRRLAQTKELTDGDDGTDI